MAVPWSKIRAEWLKGGTTYKKLGEKYNVSAKTISNRAYKEGWGKQKGKIREKVEEQLCARVTRARVNHLEKLIDANEKLLDGLVRLAELIQAKPEVMLMDKAGTVRNAESFAKALETATKTQRDLYRLPNIDQKFAAKQWKEKLKLEQQKAAGPETGAEVWEIQAPEGEELDG